MADNTDPNASPVVGDDVNANPAPDATITTDAPVAGDQGNTGAEPAKPVDVDAPDPFLSRLGEASGGRFKSEDDLVSHLTAWEQSQAELAELRAKAEINPFADERAKAINDLFAKNASTAEVRQFLEMQDLDVDALSEREVLKRAAKANNPTASDDVIDGYLDTKYGLDQLDEDGNPIEPSASQKYQMGLDVIEARNALRAQKVSAGNPKSVQDSIAQQQAQEQTRMGWSKVASPMLESMKSVTIGFKDDKSGAESSFDFPVSEEFLKEATAVVVDYAMQNNLTLNEASMPDVKAFAQRIIWAEHGPQIAEAAMRSADAKARAAMAADNGGVAVPANGSTQAPVPGVISSSKGGRTLEQIRADGLRGPLRN